MATIQCKGCKQLFELQRQRLLAGGLGGGALIGTAGTHTGLALLGTAVSGAWLLAPVGLAAGAAVAVSPRNAPAVNGSHLLPLKNESGSELSIFHADRPIDGDPHLQACEASQTSSVQRMKSPSAMSLDRAVALPTTSLEWMR
jgi:hypothetical protein